MKRYFNAKKIAVVGASRNKDKVGNIVFGNLITNSRLKVFPINPHADKILGYKAYPDLLSVPYPIDMVVIAVPAKLIPDILKQCSRKKIKAAIIISAGFSESGNSELEKKVANIAKKNEIEILGPNVLGIINPYRDLNASFFREVPERGNVAFISQSGAVGTAVLDKALERGFGFSGFVSLGNMAQEDFVSALEYFGKDRKTDVIMMYIESLKKGNGEKFVKLCQKISKKKKIVVIKAGKSEEGEKAAKTHTASLSSPAKIYSGAFKQAGIIEVNSLEEMFILSEIFSKYGQLGKKGCIITNAGGLGVLCTDSCSKSGIELPDIPEKVFKQLDKFLPEGYSRENPLDILGDALADRYSKTLKVLNMYKLFDFYIVIVSPQEMTQALETAKVLVNRNKPVFTCFVGGKSFEKTKKFLARENVINFEDVSDAGRIIGKAI